MWLLLTIVLSACAYAWEFYLDVRQHKKLMGARLPDNLVEHINPGAFKRMRRYVCTNELLMLSLSLSHTLS